MSPFLIFLYVVLILMLWLLILKKDLVALALGRQPFTCKRCAKCCLLVVRLTKEDIARMQKAGCRDFVQMRKGVSYLKQINGVCPYLSLSQGESSCSIYDARPEICRDFPAVKVWGCKGNDPRCPAFQVPEFLRRL